MKIHKEFARLFGWELMHLRKDQPTLGAHLKRLLALLEIDCLLDVGANDGQYAAMLRKIGYRGRIVSFEPVAKTYAALAEHAAKDPDWQVFHCALAAKAGRQKIRVTRSTVFASFLGPSDYSKKKYPNDMPVERMEEVRLRTLDEVLPKATEGLKAPKLFLKMDTQGYDLQVFAGAKKSLPKILALQTEISIQAIYKGMPDYLKSLGIYTKAGFVISGLYPVSRDRDTLALIELDCVMRRIEKPVRSVRNRKK
ncbi:MAG: FkbM family methyltransferase [Bacillota bacterium]